jgi:hypothetical protein
VKKVLIGVGIVLAVLAILGIVGDRVAASAAERRITDSVSQELSGATSVSTKIHGFPVLTQAAGGSLDHVTVTAATVPAEGVQLQDVVVDLYGVTTSDPRSAQRVTAQALLPTSALQAKVGQGWTVTTDGNGLVAASSGLLGLQARVVPTVRDGKLAVDVDWVKVLGAQVDGSSIPQAVTDRLDALVASVGVLPLGLTLDQVTVVDGGVQISARGTDVPLHGA